MDKPLTENKTVPSYLHEVIMSNRVRTFTDPGGTTYKRLRGLKCTQCGEAFSDGDRATTRTTGGKQAYKHESCPETSELGRLNAAKERLVVCSFPGEFTQLSGMLTALNYAELVRLEAAIAKYGDRKQKQGREFK